MALEESGGSVVELVGGNHVFLTQVPGSVEVGLSELELRLRLRELAIGAVEIGLVQTRINYEEQITLFHEAARFEVQADQITADPRADLDGFHCVGARDILVPLHDFPLRCRGDRHLGWRGGGAAPL